MASKKTKYLKPIEPDIGQSGKSLINRCLQGDETSWNLLINFVIQPMRYKLSYWVFSVKGCQADIDDIYQDFIVSLYKDDFANLRAFIKSDKHLQAWIYNGLSFQFRSWLSLDNRRKDLFEQIESLIDSHFTDDFVFELLPEMIAQFEASLNKKDGDYWGMIFHQRLDDKSIAEKMGITENGVRTRRHRVKLKFKKFLDDNLTM